MKHNMRFAAALLCWFSLALMSPHSSALPREARVAGGIALLPAGPVSGDGEPPRAWFGDLPVWVTRNGPQWVAVLGLAIDLPEGRHSLRIENGTQEKHIDFDIGTKAYPEQRITLKDTGKVHLSPEDTARAKVEIARIHDLKRHWTDNRDTASDFRSPTEGRVTGSFGLRRIFNGEARSPHNGIDIAVPRGAPVRSSARGVVLETGEYFFNGKTVFIDHGNGLLTMICHLDRIDVRPGETVGKGQPVGRSGMTGRASGPHVHWSVVLNGVMVDPALFLSSKP